MSTANSDRVVLYTKRQSRQGVGVTGRKRSRSSSSSSASSSPSRGILEILYIVKLNYIYIYIKYVCRTYDNTSTTIFY